MKKLLPIIVLISVLAGCASYARLYVWDPVTTYEGGGAITSTVTYKVYQQVGTNWVLMGTSATTNLVWNWPTGGIYTVAVTTVVGVDESDYSVPYVDDARKPGKPVNIRRGQ